jgi:hypothetical protein
MSPSSSFNNRGSVLIVALVFAAIIAVSLGSYILLANNSLKQASRSFYASSAINLAETGLELAVARFNKLDEGTAAAAWTGWTLDPTPYNATTSPFTPSATRTFSGFTPGPGATGTIKVFVQHYEGSTPTTTPRVVAQATVTQDNAPPVHKFIEVTLRKRSVLGYGVSAINDIRVVGGNFQGKSWDSDPEEDGTQVAYAEANNTANLIMGSVTGNISLGGGEVWGYTKVSDPTHTDVGGSVHGLTSTTNDEERRTDDFSANYPMRTSPSYASNPITADINTQTTFPLNAGDVHVTIPAGLPNAGEEVYVYKFATNVKIDLSGGGAGADYIKIQPNTNVILILEDHSTLAQNAIDLTGGVAYMEVGLDASLNIYTNGNVNITGGGIINPNIDSKSFMLWGTNATAEKTIKVAGNGQFTGVVYAPNANVTVKGGGTNGTVVGAVVGKTVEFNGTTQFFYDEELSELTIGNPYGAAKWKELQSAEERAVYSAALNF